MFMGFTMSEEDYLDSFGAPDEATGLTPRQMVDEIDEVAWDVCSEWEVNFIESVQQWQGDYSPKQEEVIRRIYKKVCASDF